ncbi:recombinase family protein [Mesorhizobium sp. B2-8-9]|uniref:recombinase family protein n=1 Tax=Mesorhizobium sp. B2-8-9 TaxID=2589899 RepID=UPI001FED770D|nr:recombinase family protein [Mesorhizobium sp. B2-8-9]
MYPKSGNPVPVSAVHMILRNRLYTGLFQWNGKLHQGKHEPLVSIELWERVQGVLTGRNSVPAHPIGNEFAFTGLMSCIECGCAVVAEIKKGKYVYYHCTGHTNKGRGGYGDCRRKYVREGARHGLPGRALHALNAPLHWLARARLSVSR